MTTASTTVIHVLDESASPVDALVWRMMCGEACLVFDDGECAPDLDFVSERGRSMATCVECVARLDLIVRFESEPKEAPVDG